MYNMLFGTNELALELLNILNLKTEDFGRFRDCYLSEDRTKIIVFTRCGGGNREDYDYVFEEIKEHPLYIRDYDDSFDCTYASIEFNMPKEKLEHYKNIKADTVTGPEKFKNFLNGS